MQDVSYKLYVYKALWEKTLAKYRPCTMVGRSEDLNSLGKVILHGEFSRQGDSRYFLQMQFFAHCFRDHLPIFSMRELLEKCPTSQQALISGHMFAGSYLLI
jgi:hypothetical protein